MFQKTPSRKKSVLTASIGLALGATLLLSGCTTSPSAEAGLSNTSTVIADTSITDAFGTYTSVKWNNPDEYNKINPKTSNSAAWKAQGLSDEDALAAKQFALNWVGSQLVDSSVLDNPDAYASFSNFASAYISGSFVSEMDKNNSGLVYQLPNGMKTVRDGNPRLTEATTSEVILDGDVHTDLNGMTVAGTTITTYRLTEESVTAWYKGLHPEMTDADIRSKLGLTPGKPVSFSVNIGWTYWLSKNAEGAWQIVGFGNNFTPISLNGKKDIISEIVVPVSQ